MEFSKLNGYDVKDKKAIRSYNSVASMKADTTLKEGQHVKTRGYYEVGDGGHGEYIIKSSSSEYYETLSNELVAELLINDNTINIKQLGGRSQNGSNRYDIKEYIDTYIDIINSTGIKYKLYIPSGVWHTSGNEITTPIGFNIFGDENFSFGADRIKGTILTSYNDNQDHILNLGSSSTNCMGWNVSNINFSSAEYVYNDSTKTYNYSSLKSITSAFNLLYAEYGISDNLFFNHLKGQAMSISSSWENYFKLLNFRKVTNHDGSILNFKTKVTTLSNSANITACTFENIMFEFMHGNLINSEANSSLSNCIFNTIYVEDGVYNVDGEVYTSFTNDNIPENLNHYSIFNIEEDGSLSGCHINSILLNNYSFRFFEYNDQYYTYDTIITLHNAPIFSSIFNNISVVGMKKDCYLINMPNNLTKTNFYAGHSIIKNITNDSDKNFILNLYGLNYLECDANLFGRIYTFQMPTKQFYENGGWIGCYKSFSPRQYPTGLGLLFYDSDCQNKLQLSVKTRTDVFDRPILTTITNENRKIYLRAKVPNGETCKLYLNNRDETQATSNKELLGTGSYKIYELEVPSGWSIGTRICLEMANEQGYTKNLSMDVYKSC